MNQELQLQAYLDGELPERESSQVAALIESDAAARGLYTELQQTRSALRGNEPEFTLPESRDFYWSGIEREIRRLDAAPARGSAPWWITMLRRHAAAVSGAGVAALLLLGAALQMNLVSPDLLEEIENPLEEASSFSFRSESQRMTVVWISSSSPSVSEDQPDIFDDFFQ